MTDYRQKSWWLQSLPEDIVPNPPLEGSRTADVTIIGGGYTGLSTGYHLNTDFRVSFNRHNDIRFFMFVN